MRRPRSLRGTNGGAAAPAPILPDLRLAIRIIHHCILCPFSDTSIDDATGAFLCTTMSLYSTGHTVVVTGAGGGLGRAYSLLFKFAERGANVVVNDFNPEAAQKVVDEITKVGGKVVIDTSSATHGVAVVKSALDAFGGIKILVNNAGFLQGVQEHVRRGVGLDYQKFGRILNTSSAAGLYGNLGQANYSAAKMALVGFTKTLAIEGAKYGIKSIVIASSAASRLTETVMPPEMLANLQVKAKWSELTDFSRPHYASAMAEVDSMEKLELAATLSSNVQSLPEVRFDGKTVIITGAGAGIGQAYALIYGKLGANVVVNDGSEKGANSVVDEVVKAGGKATPAICSDIIRP
ncbi:hypothetical protein FB451DRAFT_1549599 [Mycena latifolia]|nr:hypothetical protein FB451DRAFT_1549599 [Mycena latifolia]